MSTPNAVPKDRIMICSRKGVPLAEFRATVERSWVIGDEARAQFTYPSRKTDIVNEKILQFGNWLYVQNDSLPEWVGVIDIPRKWGVRDVTVSAYTPEHVFGWRRGPLEVVLTGSAGTLFEKLIGYVNGAGDTIIRPGEVWHGGTQREETINPTPLNEDLLRIVERSNEEYNWRPVQDSKGNLVVFADWARRLGVNTGILLQEGSGGGNIESVRGNLLVEDGPIINDLLAYNDGATWKDKVTAIYHDDDSIHKYGLRQSSEQFDGVTSKTTLQNNALKFVERSKDPVRTFVLNALNVGDTFDYLKLGNRFTVRFEHVGFYTGGLGYETSVRIVGMYYDPAVRNKVELTVEEV